MFLRAARVARFTISVQNCTDKMMKLWKWLILGGTLAAILAAAWIVWQLPQPVEMAATVPAETLCYFEADNLPKILQSLTNTDAWRELAPAYGVEKDVGNFGWLSQILANANLGSSETILFGRAQIAVSLMGIGTAEAGESLKIRPQFAVVIETKSNRANKFVETSVSDFARRQFGEIRIEKKETTDGAVWTIFRARADERNLFAAVAGTVVIIGNDEAAVQACLDARGGKRKSLADDPDLAKMRANTERESAFAFGFVTTEGIKQLSSVGAVLIAGQMTEDPRAMSLLAQSLPPFAQKSVTAIGWTAREGLRNKIEDRYFVQMPPDLVARLREPLTAQERNDSPAAALLPASLQLLTVYNLKNPQAAWRGVFFAMTTRLDAFSAAAFSQAANGLLEPYGIEKADDFLAATNGTLSTIRLSTAEDAAVAAVGVKDTGALKKTLLTNGKIKSDLTGDFLLLGSEESLRICREAREQNRTIGNQSIWRQFNETQPTSSGVFIRTLTRDDISPIQFVKLFSKDKNQSDVIGLEAGDKVPDWLWTISETSLVREGVERRNTSPFGLIGTLATSFAAK